MAASPESIWPAPVMVEPEFIPKRIQTAAIIAPELLPPYSSYSNTTLSCFWVILTGCGVKPACRTLAHPVGNRAVGSHDINIDQYVRVREAKAAYLHKGDKEL